MACSKASSTDRATICGVASSFGLDGVSIASDFVPIMSVVLTLVPLAVELPTGQFDGGFYLYFRGKIFPEPISIAGSR